jgi:hypothetical protein
MPFVERLLVYSENPGEGFAAEIFCQFPGDKSTATGDNKQVILLQLPIRFTYSLLLHTESGVFSENQFCRSAAKRVGIASSSGLRSGHAVSEY